MRLCAVGLLALVATGCSKGPYSTYDEGRPVHVIIKPVPRPRKPLRLRPVCTLGASVRKAEPIPVGGRHGPRAVEVAIFLAPAGRHRLSIWEGRTWSEGRVDLKVERETWVVLEIEPKKREGRVRVFDEPPHDKIGPWQPLVAVPD